MTIWNLVPAPPQGTRLAHAKLVRATLVLAAANAFV
jgi:hypothetical protein